MLLIYTFIQILLIIRLCLMNYEIKYYCSLYFHIYEYALVPYSFI